MPNAPYFHYWILIVTVLKTDYPRWEDWEDAVFMSDFYLNQIQIRESRNSYTYAVKLVRNWCNVHSSWHCCLCSVLLPFVRGEKVRAILSAGKRSFKEWEVICSENPDRCHR